MAEIKITIRGFKCERCGHEWIPRNKEEVPIICPKCKSPYWNKPKKSKKNEKEAKSNHSKIVT